MNGQSGFTSVELTVGAVLLLTVIGAFTGVQSGVMRLLSATSAVGYLDEKALLALGRVSSELRWAEGSSLLITSEQGSSRLDLRVPTGYAGGAIVWSSTITYKVEQGSVDANGDGLLNEYRLLRLQGAAKTILCENVMPGGFTAQRTSDRVSVTLMLEKADSGAVFRNNESTSVSLRNP